MNATHSTLDARNLLKRTDVSTASTKNMVSKKKAAKKKANTGPTSGAKARRSRASAPTWPRRRAPRSIDAAGKFVFPGFIDPHVHIYLPFMGTFAKDTYDTASRAALVGGTTTLIEMVCPSRADDPLEAYELWKSKAAGTLGVRLRLSHGRDAVRRHDAGRCCGASSPTARRRSRSFWPTRARSASTTPSCISTLDAGQAAGRDRHRPLRERGARRASCSGSLLAEGKTGPEWHEPSRPPSVEAEGVHHLATFAELTGAHVYVVHTSCDDALAAAPGAGSAACGCGSKR